MLRFLFPLFLILIFCSAAPAQPPAIAPVSFVGTIGKQDDPAIVKSLGYSGVLFFQTQARWQEFRDRLGTAMPLSVEIPEIDFKKQNLVLAYAGDRRVADSFTVAHSDLAAAEPGLDFLLRWDNSGEKRREPRFTKFILVEIPVASAVNVNVATQPIHPDRAPAVTEFSAVLGGKNSPDTVDALQLTITPKAVAIKPGDDIKIEFALQLAPQNDPHADHAAQFADAPLAVCVWDTVYSNGYRNFGYFVTTPDGKTTLYRPQVINGWDKNAPHPIEITARDPFYLPSLKATSLNALGVDTTAPGIYTIRGLYEETGSTENNLPGGRQATMWGGSIASNAVTVEVKN